MIENPKLNPGILSIQTRFQKFFEALFETSKPCLGCLNYSSQEFVQVVHHKFLDKCVLYRWQKFHADKPSIDKIIDWRLFVQFWKMLQVFDHSFYTTYSPCKIVKIVLYFCPNQEFGDALISDLRRWIPVPDASIDFWYPGDCFGYQ